MKPLYFVSIISITLLYISVVSGRAEQNLIDQFDRTSTEESKLWKKFTGEINDSNVPDIIDWSYAGYKHGTQGIPDVSRDGRYEIIDVTDFGAIPNDGKDDMKVFQDIIGKAKQFTLVYIPPGVFDFNVEPNSPDIEGASRQSIYVSNSYVVIRGAGAVGGEHGGTTLRLHTPFDNWGRYWFNTKWKDWHIREPTSPIKEYPKGVMSFEVKDATRISHLFHGGHKQFVKIFIQVKDGLIYNANVSRPLAQMPAEFTEIKRNGATIQEVHEIADVIGNTIYIKAPLTTPITPDCQVDINNLFFGIGYEHLHLDCGLNVPFTHEFDHNPHGKNGQYGFTGINLGASAHSWIKNVRVSNSSSPYRCGGYANSVVNVFMDGARGHHPISLPAAQYAFVGLMHNSTDRNMWHGEAVEGPGSGNVYWLVGGSNLPGPDTHGNFTRFTLYDNCFHSSHQASGGIIANRPSHLDGYTRWNNITTDNSTFEHWGKFQVTQANIIGYVSVGGTILNAFVESHGTPVTPNSLYVAQLTRRLGTMPSWIEELKEDYNMLFDAIHNGMSYLPPKPGIVKIEPGAKITGPWLWMLVTGQPLDNTTDLLSRASDGAVTELQVATEGVEPGDKVGDKVWMLAELPERGGNNLNDMFRLFPWEKHDGANVLYGVIKFTSPREQYVRMYYGTDDGTKIWLNGESVKVDLNKWSAVDYRSYYSVKIEQDTNILLVAIDTQGGPWSAHYGFQSNTEYMVIPYDREIRLFSDINGDGVVNVLDLVFIGNSFGTTNPDADLNGDGTINVLDLIIVAQNLGKNAQSGAPFLSANTKQMDITPDLVRNWIRIAEMYNDGSLIFAEGIAYLQQLLALLIPNSTSLLQNYPNPFNPETWIPYQLAKPNDVSISIYDVKGNIVKHLNLGHQQAGYYTHSSRAAYWNGRNTVEERVSTGVYFYQLKVGEFSYLRKMLIVK